MSDINHNAIFVCSEFTTTVSRPPYLCDVAQCTCVHYYIELFAFHNMNFNSHILTNFRIIRARILRNFRSALEPPARRYTCHTFSSVILLRILRFFPRKCCFNYVKLRINPLSWRLCALLVWMWTERSRNCACTPVTEWDKHNRSIMSIIHRRMYAPWGSLPACAAEFAPPISAVLGGMSMLCFIHYSSVLTLIPPYK